MKNLSNKQKGFVTAGAVIITLFLIWGCVSLSNKNTKEAKKYDYGNNGGYRKCRVSTCC